MRRLFTCLAVFLVLAAWVRPGWSEDRALLIGVGRYQVSQADLPGIDNDLRMMVQVVRLLGFEPAQTKVLRDDQATLAGIRGAFSGWLGEGAGPSDRVLIYFTGHGSQIPDQNGDEADQADEVLLPHDFQVQGGTLANTWVDDEFGQMLARLKAGEIFVIIDACHSGTATKALSLLPDEAEKFFEYRGMPRAKGVFTEESGKGSDQYVALSASADNQKAVATIRGSLFTAATWQTVKTCARQCRDLTLAELQGWTSKIIHLSVADPARAHDPQLTGNLALADRPFKVCQAGTGPPAQTGELWTKLEGLVAEAGYQVAAEINQPSFRVGDTLTISCQVDRPGYLNVVSIGPGEDQATVLFPNKFHPANMLTSGGRLSIPGPGDSFVLRAREPRGRFLVVVLHSQRPVNFYTDGSGKADDQFSTLSVNSYRGFQVEAKPGSTTGYGAAKVVTSIE